MTVAVGAMMFFLGLFVGVLIFMKDESWEVAKKKLLDYIYLQLVTVMRMKKESDDEIYRSHCDGAMIALEKVRDYILELPGNDE
ncbi:MAG: hypothetical protein ACOX6S_08215 [Clostridia bacterium]